MACQVELNTIHLLILIDFESIQKDSKVRNTRLIVNCDEKKNVHNSLN